MPTRRLPPKNDYERAVLRNVERFGWHCTSVMQEGEDGEPPFTYTVGLFDTYGASELVIFGLDQVVSHSLLSLYAERLAARNPIALDVPCTDLIKGYSSVFVPVPRPRYDDYVFTALWYYAGVEFPLHQLVWPDAQGRFPWHPEARPSFKTTQPVLGLPGGG